MSMSDPRANPVNQVVGYPVSTLVDATVEWRIWGDLLRNTTSTYTRGPLSVEAVFAARTGRSRHSPQIHRSYWYY